MASLDAIVRDDALSEAVVVDGKVILIGDRVRHYGQRYNFAEGTATVVACGHCPERSDWIMVEVKPDQPLDSYGVCWDWDRTVFVSR